MLPLMQPTIGSDRGLYLHRPPRPIARVGYPEAGESLIGRMAQRRLLVRFHNQYLNQLVRGVQESLASKSGEVDVYSVSIPYATS